ncbi:acetate/propionate family kinase, partial [Patescibacteria group bacterium]|nr:acetate/propionate family kinase [Patescibacteria group bacterium]
MKILVLNSGSSSIKFKLLEKKKNWEVLNEGIIDRITNKNRENALKKIINQVDVIDAIGHRVVHGGAKYKDAVKVNAKIKRDIKKLSKLAPLHNPHNLAGIIACEKFLKGIPNIAVFDTAFYADIPQKAFEYAIPQKIAQKYQIRKYGFHGTSHKYITEEIQKNLKNKNAKIITCHLGNGSSISATKNGKCIDTSMGFTPLAGIPMGTRCGDIDPSIPMFLKENTKLSASKINEILNKESGILAISGISSDMRNIWAKTEKKNKAAIFTLEFLAYKIAMQIGAYITALNGVDAIGFTAGIGENAWYLRKAIFDYLEFTGLKFSKIKNKKNEFSIHEKNSKIKIF